MNPGSQGWPMGSSYRILYDGLLFLNHSCIVLKDCWWYFDRQLQRKANCRY